MKVVWHRHKHSHTRTGPSELCKFTYSRTRELSEKRNYIYTHRFAGPALLSGRVYCRVNNKHFTCGYTFNYMLCAYSTRRACELLVAGGNIKAGAPAHWARCVMCGAVHPRMLADVAMLRCCRPPPTEKKGWNTLGHNMQLSFEERPTQPPNHPTTHTPTQICE